MAALIITDSFIGARGRGAKLAFVSGGNFEKFRVVDFLKTDYHLKVSEQSHQRANGGNEYF